MVLRFVKAKARLQLMQFSEDGGQHLPTNTLVEGQLCVAFIGAIDSLCTIHPAELDPILLLDLPARQPCVVETTGEFGINAKDREVLCPDERKMSASVAQIDADERAALAFLVGRYNGGSSAHLRSTCPRARCR